MRSGDAAGIANLGAYRLTIMPKEPIERAASLSPEPDVPRRGPRTLVGAGVAAGGLVAVAALVIVLAGGSLAGGAAASGSPAAVISPTVGAVATPPSTSAVPSIGPSIGPSAAPTGPSPTPPSGPPASPSPAPSPSEDPAALAARLDARLQVLLERSGIPGVSAAVLWDDGRSWLGAAGSADLANGRPMTTGTAFALASVSKTLTAAVVLQLVGEGSLSLDQPVAPLLPAFGLDARITVRMLLDHTSGLPDYFLNPKIDKPLQAEPDATWTAARAWSYLPVKPVKRPVPGTAWGYANSNYLLLGELVERVTGHALASEIRHRLLGPLGLETAWYQAVEKPRAQGATGYRRVAKSGGGYRYLPVAAPSSVMPFRSVVTAAGGAGSIAATARDTAAWMQAFAGGRVLPRDLQAAMIADADATTALGSRIPYGLGIEVVALDGRRALGHSGRYLGFRNVVLYVPEVGVTIAVLTNQGTYNPARIAMYLLRVVAPRPVATPSPGPQASGSPGPLSPGPSAAVPAPPSVSPAG
jgi:D-alanyl-D-alanine carboxypeptidase